MDTGMIKAVIKNLLGPFAGPILWGLVGFFVGLVIFGWWLTPVTFVNGAPKDLRAVDYQQFYLRGLAHQLTMNEIDDATARIALGIENGGEWEDVGIAICNARDAAASGSFISPTEVAVPAAPQSVERLNRLVQVLGQGDCTQIQNAAGVAVSTDPAAGETVVDPPDGGIGGWFTSLAWLLVIGLLAGAIWWLWNRDLDNDADDGLYPVDPPGGASSSMSNASTYEAVDTDFGGAMPAGTEGGGEGGIIPISTYRTTYTYGQDAYDDSFSIESATGEFLGECGVGISETMGSGGSRAVSA
ncbi:MAG: hypothetical protein AAGD96_32940, partial [Chloroflexota bacterium]